MARTDNSVYPVRCNVKTVLKLWADWDFIIWSVPENKTLVLCWNNTVDDGPTLGQHLVFAGFTRLQHPGDKITWFILKLIIVYWIIDETFDNVYSV